MKRFSKKEVDIEEVNEVVDWGKKILKLTYTVMIIGLVLCVFLFFKSFGIFKLLEDILITCTPLLIGFIIAWLFKPLVNKLEKKGMRKWMAASVVYIIFIGIIALSWKISVVD